MDSRDPFKAANIIIIIIIIIIVTSLVAVKGEKSVKIENEFQVFALT